MVKENQNEEEAQKEERKEEGRGRWIYPFPRAAVASYHTFGGFKQQKFILSQFWGPKVKVLLPLKPLGERIILASYGTKSNNNKNDDANIY